MKKDDNQIKVLVVGLILCLTGLIFQSYISSQTASVEYVDRKCQEIKIDTEKKFDRIDNKLDQLINMHLEK